MEVGRSDIGVQIFIRRRITAYPAVKYYAPSCGLSMPHHASPCSDPRHAFSEHIGLLDRLFWNNMEASFFQF